MRLIFLTIACLLLFGCASPYQRMSSDGGYYERKINENEYIVGYNGNSFTNYKDVADYAVLRAAEIGEKLGYKYFSIEGQRDASTTIVYPGDSTSRTTGTAYSYGNTTSYNATTNTTSGDVVAFKPRAELKIKYFTEKPTGRFLELYEVSEKLNQLKSAHKIK